VASNAEKPSSKRKILLVDDEPDVLFAVRLALEKGGFTVHAYENPEKALIDYRPGSYDLLIIDIKMPFMNGLELGTKMRELDPRVRICFLTAINDLTAYGDYYRKCSAIPGETIAFTQKPIENEVLLSIARELSSRVPSN
jgi:two-component system, OmpR family, response regulator ChvI